MPSRGGAAQTRSDDSALLPTAPAPSGLSNVVAPGVATVDFSITDQGSGGYQQRFEGNVVLADGRWKISLATVWMLVEAESYVCPNPPKALPGAGPLPLSLSSDVETAHQEPDLLRPQALAIEPNDDLLIVDSDRDPLASSLRAAGELGNEFMISYCGLAMGCAAAALGESGAACVLLGAALGWLDRRSMTLEPVEQMMVDNALALLRTAIGRPALDELMRTERLSRPEEALARYLHGGLAGEL